MAVVGMEDISPDKSGGLMKTLVSPGIGQVTPFHLCPCVIHYIGRLWGPTGAIFATTRDEVDGKMVGGADDPVTFTMGRDDTLPPAVHKGVGSMTQGEVAQFVARPEFGFGAAGDGHKVPPNATLWYDIELVRIDAPVPDMGPRLTPEERAKQKKENALAEALEMPSADSRFADASENKAKGNEAVKAGDWEAAKKHYDSGFTNSIITKDEIEAGTLAVADQNRLGDLRGTLHLNRALVNVKLQAWDDALWDCDQGLLVYPDHVQGNYRRGLVYEAKLKEVLAKEDAKEYWDETKARSFVDAALGSLSVAKAGSEKEGKPTDAIDKVIKRVEALEARRKFFVDRAERAQVKAFKNKFLPTTGGGGEEEETKKAAAGGGAGAGAGAGAGVADTADSDDEPPGLDEW